MLGLERSFSLPWHVVHKASSTSILIGMDESGEAEEPGRVWYSQNLHLLAQLMKINMGRLSSTRTARVNPHRRNSTSSTLLPTIMSLDSATASMDQDFPFSINHPLPADILNEQPLTVPYMWLPKGITDHGLRTQSAVLTAALLTAALLMAALIPS